MYNILREVNPLTKKISIILLTLLFLTLGLMVKGVPALENSESRMESDRQQVTYTREDIREKLKKKFNFDYLPYIKGEKKLGFSPDKALYKRLYYYVTLKYVEPVEDKAILEGVFSEVKKLLVQAKVDPSGLSKVPRSNAPMEDIVKAYGDKVNPDILRFAVIRGMMDGLNDPHSVFLLPDDYQRLQESMSGGNFYGIGVYIMLDPENYNWLTVSEPIEGTPAYKAGLKPGDVVTAIDGETTKGQDIDVAITKIRGKEGTSVKLTIKRKGEKNPIEVSIKRAFIHVNSVKAKLVDGNIGYIKLRTYGSDSGEEIEKALNELKSKGAKSLILDLRNNSGGLIDAAVDVCSMFLPDNSPVVKVVSRGGYPKVMRTNGGKFVNLPLVVMTNELSASASEITAGCLKDQKRAKIIGEKTFGKGSVQELMSIRNDGGKESALKITIALFYTPNNFKINKVGLEPDIKVPMDLREADIDKYEKDIQLQRAIKFIKTGK